MFAVKGVNAGNIPKQREKRNTQDPKIPTIRAECLKTTFSPLPVTPTSRRLAKWRRSGVKTRREQKWRSDRLGAGDSNGEIEHAYNNHVFLKLSMKPGQFTEGFLLINYSRHFVLYSLFGIAL